MSSISIVYRKDKLNKKGEAPVHFRIIKDRKISYIASGFMIPLDMWDFEKNQVKAKYPNSARIRSVITNKFSEIQDQVLEYDNNNKTVTSRNIRNEVYGKKPTGFFEFAESLTEELLKNGGKYGTYSKNLSVIEKLRGYVKHRKITFQEIDSAFLTNYEIYLRTHHKNKTNTVSKDFRYFRRIFKEAFRRDLIDYKDNPFLKYKIKHEKTTRDYLTEDELTLIETFPTTPGTRLELHKDMFIFASYVAGIRVSDVLLLRWEQFDGIHLSFSTKKTTNQISVKVPNKGIEILNKYRTPDCQPNDFIFPMLKNDLDTSNDKELDNAISCATAYINKNLNIIRQKLGINKKLSFHVSRHTWATRALRKGMKIQNVSALLTHSDLKTTQIYAKIVDSELDKAMDVFND
jgi:site-specific recombinase XerD